MQETIFCQKTEVFSSNLHAEQNLVHLGRFLHFSQNVAGVTLNFGLIGLKFGTGNNLFKCYSQIVLKMCTGLFTHRKFGFSLIYHL